MSAPDEIHVGGMCPVQGEGEVDGHRWYFKARGQRWTLYVSAQPGGEPLAEDAWRLREPWGDEPFAAGYMPWDVAEGFVRAGLAKWRAERAQLEASAPDEQGLSTSVGTTAVADDRCGFVWGGS